MKDIDALLSKATHAMRPLLEQAYAAGRRDSDAELNALKAKIAGLLGGDVARRPEATEDDATISADTETEERAVPGTVKPVILRLLRDSRAGMSTSDITKHTGFKHNSVRGTLWSLRKEGLIHKDNGRWFANTPYDLLSNGEASHATN